MGEILGYPCYRDFENIDDDKVNYIVSVNVKVEENIIQLFVNICKDETNIEKFNEYVEKIKSVLNKEEYKNLLNGLEIKEVNMEIKKTIPAQQIINDLIENKTLEQDEIDEIQNILLNYGFS